MAESEADMTVKELVSCCYEKIIIYTPIDEDYMDYKDLYKGNKEDIPDELLKLEVRCCGAKRKGVIDISVR